MHNPSTTSQQHIPVLAAEITEFLMQHIPRDGFHIDATLGLGGHAKWLLEAGFQGIILGIDWDPENLSEAKKTLEPWKHQCLFEENNFKNIAEVIHKAHVKQFDSILFDVGISSVHVDKAERGFSFLKDGPLDMRYHHEGITAYDIVNFESEAYIAEIIWKFGEERLSRHIAAEIIRRRKGGKISTTLELAKLVSDVYHHKGFKRSAKHPATKTFQALRIAVNDELGNIETALQTSIASAKKGAYILTISYHSLEDRLIKTLFRKKTHEGILKIINKKVIVPWEKEIALNPRSRSAKLRIVQRIE